VAGGVAVIYLDSAATTLQKPPAVARAMARAVGTMTSPGRGNHGPANRAARILLALREKAGELFGLSRPEQVILTASATHGLNLAIKSLVRPGSAVLLSGWEHNAVTRPLASIPGVRVGKVEAPLFRPDLFLADLDRKLAKGADSVIVTHVSNVFGYILPLDEIAARCRARQIPLLVDASQSAGVLPVRMDDWGAEFVAMPGHKGLYGPQGTGLLLVRDTARPLLEGGTGSQSRLQAMPDFLPDRLEAGTHNIPGAAGLLEGLRFVEKTGLPVILRHETALLDRAAAGLARLPGVRVFRGEEAGCQCGVLSFQVEGRDPGELADSLADRGIAVRSGLHCAPLAHAGGGTEEAGTVRMSFSAFNTAREIDRALEILAELV